MEIAYKNIPPNNILAGRAVSSCGDNHFEFIGILHINETAKSHPEIPLVKSVMSLDIPVKRPVGH